MKKALVILALLGFTLGSYKGYVTLWRDGSDDPYQIYPYKVETLPLEDQKDLEAGIHVPGERELQRLLEDYLS